MKHLSGEKTSTVRNESNQGFSVELCEGLAEQELSDQVENEDRESSLSMQNILGGFLAAKLQVIEHENKRISRNTVYNKRQKHKINHESSSTKSSRQSFDCSDVLAEDEFKNDNNTENFQSNSKNPESLDFWNYSEHSCNRAVFDRTCLKNLHEDRHQSHQSHRKIRQNRDEKISGMTVLSGSRSSALKHCDCLERSCGNGALPFLDMSLEHSDKEKNDCRVNGKKSSHDCSMEISHECLSDFQNDSQLESVCENPVHKSKRKRSFPKKSKEASESRHKKSKKKRSRKDSVEVSTHTSPNFQTASSNAEATSRCYRDSSYDDVKGVESENDREDFGYSRERHSWSGQNSCDSFQPCARLLKTDHQVCNSHKQSTNFKLNDNNDLSDETWIGRYNRTKRFRKSRSYESIPAEIDNDSLKYNDYSQAKTTDPIFDHSSKYNGLECEDNVFANFGDKGHKLSHSRSKTHSRTKSPMSSSKKKSSRKAKNANKREKKHKHRAESPWRSSSEHKSTKPRHRKNKNADKILAEPNEKVENAKSSVLPSDDDDSFRPMLIRVENNDDITELLLKKSATSKDGASEQCGRQQLDYNAVVACAESNSVPSRIVKTYKEGVAVSRLLRRVKTRIGPIKPVKISRLQATLPRHPVLTVDKFSQRKSANSDQLLNSDVVQDVEDPGAEKLREPQTCSVLPTISDFAKEHMGGDILKPLGVLGEHTVVQTGPDDHTGLIDKSDPNDHDQLSGHADALQETVALNLLSKISHMAKQGVEANTSLDPLMTVEMAAANLKPCLSLSSETVVTGNSSVEMTETYTNDRPQERSISEVASEALVGVDVEPDDRLPSHIVTQLLENSGIQHSSDQAKLVATDEVEDTLNSNCHILPELAHGSCCSDGGCQKVGNEEVTAIVSPSSLEGVAVVISDLSGTLKTTFAEATSHRTDSCPQAEVSKNRPNLKQCCTLVVPEIVGIGAEVTGKEESMNKVNEIEVTGKEVTGKEVNENAAGQNEVSDVNMIQIELSRSDVSEGVECHYTQKGMNSESWEIVNKASSSQGSSCIRLEVEHTKEVIFSSGQSLDEEQENSEQALKINSLNENVIAGCADIPCDAEPLYESVKCQASQEDHTTVKKPAKKLTRHMGIKISGWSAAFISSGTLYENDPKKQNREEGELTDSSANTSESEISEPAPMECPLDLESSGSLSESAEEEVEQAVVRHKSKKRKKHKRKHKKQKKHKRHHSKESSSDEGQSRSRLRSRSRSFSVARTFDEEKGVWREKKHKHKRKKVCEKNRPRLNIDKEKLREIAIKNSLHNHLSFNRPTMKSNELLGTQLGGKSVAELTDFCKTLSGRMDYSSSSSEDENSLDARQRVSNSQEDDSEMFINNFMKGKDKDARIVLNIRDSRPLPALTGQQMIAKKAVMRLMFPVSSGAQHRSKEEGWVPVMKPDQEKQLLKPQVQTSNLPFQTVTIPAFPPTSAGVAAVELATARAPAPENLLPPLPLNADSNMIITEQLAAIRRLNANPTNEKALEDVLRAQMQMQQWAEEKQIPGQFFSSVVRMGLTGNKLKKHDWLRRTKQTAEPGLVLPDAAAAALQSDPLGGNGATNFQSTLNPQDATGPDGTYNIGKLMMLRMGWKECEGLGRLNLGKPTPLSLDVKRDRKGLQAPEERIRPLAQIHSVKGKHPVSALMEICVKLRIGCPEFVLVDETGPSHLKRFLYKVIVNGVEYQPNVGSQNKKTAKLQAAVCCLNALGFGEESK